MFNFANYLFYFAVFLFDEFLTSLDIYEVTARKKKLAFGSFYLTLRQTLIKFILYKERYFIDKQGVFFISFRFSTLWCTWFV